MNRRSLIVATAMGATVLGAWWRNRKASDPQAVVQFFAQTLPDADGKPQALSQWKGQLLIVNFWATWCAPCVEEMPELQRVRAEYKTRDVELIGIAIDNADKVRAFRDQLQLQMPLLIAGASGSELSKILGNDVGAVPYTVLINRSGKISKRQLGQVRKGELNGWLDAELS